jgi:hypothetical protein
MRVLLAVALVAALAGLPAAERGLRVAPVQYEDGAATITGAPPGTNTLVDRIQAEAPKREPVYLVVRGVGCTGLPLGHGGGLQFWLRYRLLPHPVTCDPTARWQAYLDTEPPDGAVVLSPRVAYVHP